MPTFHITAPDGTAYEVTGPDGSTEQQALAQVQSQHQASSGGILKNIGAGFEGALTGAPEMVNNLAIKASPWLHALETAPSALTSYFTGKAAPIPEQVVSAHNINSQLGKVSPTLNPENVTVNTFPERLARGAGAGLTGALIPGEGGFTVGQMLANAATGAISGAGAATGAELAPERYKPLAALVGGMAAPMAAAGLANLAGRVANALKSAATGFTGAAPEQTVGKVLAEASGGSIGAPAEAPLPGMKPTAGQATGNPGLLYLERSAEQASPEGKMLGEASRSASNQAITDAIDQIGSTGGTPSETMLNRLEAAQKAAKVATAAKWEAAGVNDSTPLPKDILQGRVDEYVNGLTTANRKIIPGDILATLKEIPTEKATLGEIQDWRSQLGDEIRSAFRGGMNNKARVLGGLENITGDFLDEAPATGAATDLTAYKAARDATRQMKQTFNQPGSPIVTALSPKEFGAAAESNAANLFIRPASSAGAPEAFNSYLKAIGDDEQGLQAARDAFAQKFKAAITGPADSAGSATIKPAAVSKFIDQYDHVINSDLFTDDQRDLLDRIDKAAQMTARTARAGAPGGSDTFAKLSGKNWVDALVGAGAKKIARTVGASAGYATGGPVGAMAGAYSGPKIMETMLSANKEASMKLLTQALYDPELATTLMTKATASSANSIPLPIQARIFRALAATAASDSARRAQK